ncbi:hypothetical protein PR048_033219 [Dryococelus australis]|uniref:Uncharacterized protein n=1 Tax=Dryococelus australis TaxID=614101 RepID=A0ABQ9FZN8_9NEOP|nr:hypothetical protein PR048_033219 [Dryococelus australis]
MHGDWMAGALLQMWCQENVLHTRNLYYASKVREQLAELCARCSIALTSCGQDTEQVRRCLLAGLFTSVAELQRDRRHYLTVSSSPPIFTLHVS